MPGVSGAFLLSGVASAVEVAAIRVASEAMGYTVDHTSIVYLVAPDGRMKKAMPHGGDPATLSAAIVEVLGSADG